MPDLDDKMMIRFRADQKAALQKFIDKYNAKRTKAGKKPIKLATWMRELALNRSGNGHLGAAGDARRAAEDMKDVL